MARGTAATHLLPPCRLRPAYRPETSARLSLRHHLLELHGPAALLQREARGRIELDLQLGGRESKSRGAFGFGRKLRLASHLDVEFAFLHKHLDLDWDLLRFVGACIIF